MEGYLPDIQNCFSNEAFSGMHFLLDASAGAVSLAVCALPHRQGWGAARRSLRFNPALQCVNCLSGFYEIGINKKHLPYLISIVNLNAFRGIPQ
ncbi:hypothetical protein [Paraburkholderia strydomiana]|uniref:hypothetical protein n=1 Tax=Paraburkholderia strydomiana TaxID=1245417 RepID=UPI0038B6D69F